MDISLVENFKAKINSNLKQITLSINPSAKGAITFHKCKGTRTVLRHEVIMFTNNK